MSDQCKVSKPAALADDTEGEETDVKSLVSPQLWHMQTKMSFQMTNSDLSNLMFTFTFCVLKENVEIV